MLQSQIEQQILKNLHVTKPEFDSWKTKSYPTDPIVLEQFQKLIEQSDQVHIIGDYDCDGVCSTYIMQKLIESTFHKPCDHLIPRRFTDGYGIKSSLIDQLYEKDKEALDAGKKILLITVDNGIAGAEAIRYANSLHYQVIVTDHHELGNNQIPEAELVIDPKVQEHNPFSYDGYCGAGVAYKLAENFVKNPKFIRHLRFFAALATVADVMSLREENHTLVSTAMQEFKDGYAPFPFQYLAKASGFSFEFLTEKDFGFLFGPIVNASGRLHDAGASEVLDFFLHPTEQSAERLVAINQERKQLVKDHYEVLKYRLDQGEVTLKSPLWLYHSGIPEGIVGILAGKIAEDYQVPCILLTDSENPDIYKGSGRSTTNFHLFDYLSQLDPEIFAGFGGHAGAAGVSIKKEQLQTVMDLPDLQIREDSQLNAPSLMILPEQIPEAWQAMRTFAPFGEGNPELLFAIPLQRNNARIRMVGANQDTMSLSDPNYKIVCFRYPKAAEALDQNENVYDVVGSLSMNVYQNKATIQCCADKLQNHDLELERAMHAVDDVHEHDMVMEKE